MAAFDQLSVSAMTIWYEALIFYSTDNTAITASFISAREAKFCAPTEFSHLVRWANARSSVGANPTLMWTRLCGGQHRRVKSSRSLTEAATSKPVASVARAAGQPPKYQYLDYPNIPGEDLLENDLVIVQRFVVQPGQWEGVHAHHPDMLYIHVKGGQWAARSKSEPEHRYPDRDKDGAAGWMPPVPLSAGHESGNAGDQPIDLIWVTLKK